MVNAGMVKSTVQIRSVTHGKELHTAERLKELQLSSGPWDP